MASEPASTSIRAAGGVLWRLSHGGTVEVAVVYRPRYGDWSLPKGKLNRGEAPLSGAVREIAEETGVRAGARQYLGRVRYPVLDAAKIVDHWALQGLGGEFVGGEEVSDIAWLTLAEAADRVSYDHDRRILDLFATAPPPDAVVVLVRHAKAGKRSEWGKADRLRPLDRAGKTQAGKLAVLLDAFAPQRLISADRTRCRETIAPLAQRSGLHVEIENAFDDDRYVDAPDKTMALLMEFGSAPGATVVCSQGVTIPGLVEQLELTDAAAATRKAATWAICFRDGRPVSADHYPPPAG